MILKELNKKSWNLKKNQNNFINIINEFFQTKLTPLYIT
jgi:hypothetical protein